MKENQRDMTTKCKTMQHLIDPAHFESMVGFGVYIPGSNTGRSMFSQIRGHQLKIDNFPSYHRFLHNIELDIQSLHETML